MTAETNSPLVQWDAIDKNRRVDAAAKSQKIFVSSVVTSRDNR
jgi:hypothetical protein